MLKLLRTRIEQGQRTLRYPEGPTPALAERFRGHPVITGERCVDGCTACAERCPTAAITLGVDREPRLAVDLGRCLFCAECATACPTGALAYGSDHRLAARSRADLVVDEQRTVRLATALDAASRRLFGRSLKLRQVSAGGCNGCESEINVLSTVVWDLGRFGVQIVASPRHADGLIVTGPVTDNMRLALQQTYEAVAPPKLVVAVGACAIAGGPFVDLPAVANGADAVVPVDLYVPGCPPHPLTILDGLLRLLGRIEAAAAR
jgi:Ni,Fe-hydrogenase III small subunit/ferredoxin